MQFIDEVVIRVRSGDGGNGCAAFRRESKVPKGGPAGGDGGRGGDVILLADPGMSTLLDCRYQREYKAARGQHGQGHDRDGRGAPACTISVPCGTLVYDNATNEILADLVSPNQTFIVAPGGRGGRGNRKFVSSTNRAPRQFEYGEPGIERELRLELKLLADIGLVGLPNAGKSTFISKVSAARPRIADYPFTTLTPQLGVVRLGADRTFVLADIPGLIEGAHTGQGLGHRFLRHIERTRVLIFLLDDRHVLEDTLGSASGDLQTLRSELEAFSPHLASKPFIVALNKCDLLLPSRQTEIIDELKIHTPYVNPISSLSGLGMQDLLERVWALLESLGQRQSGNPVTLP